MRIGYLVLLFVLCNSNRSSQLAIGKAVQSSSEVVEDCNSAEPSPEVSSVHNEEIAGPLHTSSKAKRCSRRRELVGDPVLLSMRRRETDEDRKKTQCEKCRLSSLCKSFKMCKHCKRVCEDVDTPTEQAATTQPTVAPEDGVLLGEGSPDLSHAEKLIQKYEQIPADLEKTMVAPKIPLYYTIGQIPPGPLMDLLLKIFSNVGKSSVSRLIVVAQHVNPTDPSDSTIQDLAMVLSKDGKFSPGVYRIPDVFDNDNSKLTEEINDRIHSALELRKQQHKPELTPDEVDRIISDILSGMNAGKNNDVVGVTEETTTVETQTRCNLEDEVDEVFSSMVPVADRTTDEDKTPRKSPVTPIRNPAIIEDKPDVVGREIDGAVDDNYEVPDNHNHIIPHPEPVNKDPISHHAKDDSVVAEPPDLIEDSDNSLLQPESDNLQDARTAALPLKELEDSVMNVVKESLKAAQASDDNLFQEVGRPNPVLEESPTAPLLNSNPTTRTIDSVIKEIEKSPTANSPAATEFIHRLENQHQNINGVLSDVVEQPEEVGARFDDEDESNSVPGLGNRGQFEDDRHPKTGHFGSLVPVVNPDPDSAGKPQKVYFVGKDINLPLQVYKDENGVIQLSVDMEELCHCKNTNCTRKHHHRHQQMTELPEDDFTDTTSLRFRKNTGEIDDFVDEIVDPLQGEKFKRSAELDEPTTISSVANEKYDDLTRVGGDYQFNNEKLLEEKLKKLNDDVEKFNKENEGLLNRGTVALLQNIDKTKNVEKMVDLTNSVLSWMKEVAKKHL